MIMEGSLAHATFIIHASEVVVRLAPAYLLGRSGDGLHVAAHKTLVELGSLFHLAIFVLCGATNLVIIVSKHLVKTELGVRSFLVALLALCLGHVSFAKGKVRVLAIKLGL